MIETITQTGEKGHYIIKDADNCASKLSIREFYRDAVVFITGGTGFLGKALIEKLLRTCIDIRAIYIHLRSKRGMTSQQRYQEFVKHKIFDRIRIEKPEVLRKLTCIAGDIMQPNIGLNGNDYEMVLKNVSIVFHNAATVKFNEPLKKAANLNVFGTEKLMEMCTKMANLKSVIHVSTAYCNPGRKYVRETVYPSSSPLDKDSFMKCVRILPEKVLNSILEFIKGPHPNTYTLTKSIGELIVSEYSHKFPLAIVRPSIITGSVKEPFPGWVDNIQGITGVMMEIGRGTIASILGDSQLICDIMPVDIVVNTMIGAAWKTSIHKDRHTQVFNCTSGQMNPILLEEIGCYTEKWARRHPSIYVSLYPNFSYRKNRIVHKFYDVFFHLLPALIFDIILTFQGLKPIMMKITRKFQNSCEAGTFFVLNEWIFENKNIKQLIKEMNATIDGNEFPCDVTKVEYDDYIKNFILGIRKYVLKDGEETLSKARRKLSTLFWSKVAFQVILGAIVVFSVAKIIV